jgi:CubicO group peptidase (beta-lactamase class C family)
MSADVHPTDAAARAVDRYLQHAVPFGFSGAVLLATGDDVRLARGYGVADRDARRLNRSSTVFSLGSVTKPLTATAVLVLVDEGRVRLDDRLGDRLAGVPRSHADITIEHLLSHTAGLPDATGEDFDPGERDEVLSTIFGEPPRFPPGTAYAYSNAGYSVLAAILEDVAGEPFEAALRRLVLDPAGMTDTGYRLPAWDRSDLAHFFVGDRDLGVHLDKEYPSWHIIGNGEMLSTVHDLHRFTRVLATGSLLRPSTLEDAFTPRHGSYGLGWSVEAGEHGRVVGHDGASTNGVSARLRWFRDFDTVLAMPCNRDYSGGFLVHAVGPHVEALAFGGNVPMPPEVPDDRAPAVSGTAETYRTDDGGRLALRSGPDGVTVTIAGQDLLDLVGGTPPDASRRDASRATLDMVRALIAGDDRPFAEALDGDRGRAARYRSFAIDRLGTDPEAIEMDGTLPVTLSIGPATAVQLSIPGEDVEGTLRVFWSDDVLVGLGYGTRPLLELPLVPTARDRFVLHHLALGTTVHVSIDHDGAMTLAGPGATLLARPAT